ncbi:MAG TPA: hypothetical protein EYG73_07665 [Arcobacter sp.]|nr:hypothetical protein [Arcobacter sp.]
MKTIIILILFSHLSLSFENQIVKIYKNKLDISVGITNKIIIKLEENTTLANYEKDFNLTKIKKLSNNLFLVKVSDTNQTLDTANKLNNSEGIEYAHPDFIKKRVNR